MILDELRYRIEENASAVRASVASHAGNNSVHVPLCRGPKYCLAIGPAHSYGTIVEPTGAPHFVFGRRAAWMDSLRIGAGSKEHEQCGDERKLHSDGEH